MGKRIEYRYIVDIYSRKYDAYVEFGIYYGTKEECLDHLKKHAQQCLEIWNKYCNDITSYKHALHYLQEYEDITQHPVTLRKTRYVTEISTTAQQINILEDK